MRDDLTLAGYSPSTVRIYLHYGEAFAKYFMRSPTQMGEDEVRTFLLHLLEVRKLSHQSYRQAYSALKFLYTVTLKRPCEIEFIPCCRKVRKLPDVLSGKEVEALFKGFINRKYRTLAMTVYGAGLRVSEACRLAIPDIDSKRMLIHVRLGKGGKDRFVVLSARLLSALRAWWAVAKPVHYLFEGTVGLNNPMNSASFRNALRRAVARAGIKKKVTSHMLRHSFATHLMELGTDITIIKALLGHRYLRSSSGYIHVSTHKIQNTKSPLDILGTPQSKVLG
jgi:site-specific recombinase XerD